MQKDFINSQRIFPHRCLKRYDPKDIRSVKDKSRRPKRVRKPRWSYELIIAVKELRQLYPRWGKEKLVVLVGKEGYKTSASTVGRIIKYLKTKGDLVEPRGICISAKRRAKRPYAVRKPKASYPCIPHLTEHGLSLRKRALHFFKH